ncbi:MAG TPA: hypothetical protein VG188_03980 [Solirubrobacteraceae bacterium]|nr:hypothetical protein [Solirubrobacteraceae bacterium]
MAFVLPTGAFAAEEGLSNYNNKPSTTPTTPTTSTPATTPTSGTSPEKAESTPTKTTAPEEKAKEPTKTTTTSEPAKASTLPFTGFDLRWTVAAGVLLLAMGFSIVVAQRRQGRKGER